MNTRTLDVNVCKHVLLIDRKKTDCRKLKNVSKKFKRDQQESHFKTIGLRQQISSEFEGTIYMWLRYGCAPHVASRTPSPLNIYNFANFTNSNQSFYVNILENMHFEKM